VLEKKTRVCATARVHHYSYLLVLSHLTEVFIMDRPSIGARIRFQSNCGTVRYFGPLSNAKGMWIGVEWDDPNRGKHDGSKDGIRYFDCE
jgi:hypothetical protein